MTWIRVDAEQVAEVAAVLDELAVALESAGEVGALRWGLGTGATAGALEACLGDWRHARLLLARNLRDLGDRARTAGGGYVDTEAAVAGRLLTGGSW